MKILIYVVSGIAILLIIIALYKVGKKVNYSLNYESMVVETIQENVKENCLKSRKME